MKTRSMVLASVLLLGAARSEAAPPRGTPVLIELPPGVLGTDVGAAGFVVLANRFGEPQALTWMPAGGVTALGGWTATAVSRDGRAIAGTALNTSGVEEAAIWEGGTRWRLLGSIAPNAQPCDLLLSSSYGASDDGKVIVGLAWNGCRIAHAFRWEESTGMVDLGTLNGESTRANGVSGDGRVVVGWQEDVTGVRLGAKWVDGTETMIQGPNGPVGEAHATNRDGSLIVGSQCNFFDPTPSAWTWTAADGVRCFPVRVGPLLPAVPRQALMLATSEDGRVIGGALSFGLESEALVWFDGEVFLLEDYLRANGVPDAFEGWVNTGFVLAMTPDGRTLVGYGAGPSTFQGYMVVLPELE